MEIILPILEEEFLEARKKLNISSIRHGIDINEVLNEIWHQIFGNINEQLVKLNLFKQPDYFEDEGRYLKCIEIR